MLNLKIMGQQKLEIIFTLTTKKMIWKLLRFVKNGKRKRIFPTKMEEQSHRPWQLFKVAQGNSHIIKGSLEQPHGMNCLHPSVTCNLAFFAKFIPLFVGYISARKIVIFVRRDWIAPTLFKKRVTVEEKDCYNYYSERELTFFFETRNVVNQQEIGSLLIFANRHFSCVFFPCLFLNDCFN